MTVDIDFLKDLYIQQGKTVKDISSMLNLSYNQVKILLKKHNIKKITVGHTAGKRWYNNGIKQILSNTCPDGFVPGLLTTTTQKISKKLQNHIVTLETRNKISNKNIGKKHTQETRQVISQFMTNNHPMLGKHHTVEAINKIKEARAKQIMQTPVKDALEIFVSTHKLQDYVIKGVIDIEKICNELNLPNDSNIRSRIYNIFSINGISFSFGNNHLSENKLKEWIETFYDKKIIQDDRKTLPGYELDLYFPDCNVAIEYNGCYWHSINKDIKNKQYHYKKSLYARNNGIRIIHIWEDQWKNERLRPILEGIIKAALKIKSTDNIIYARKCEIRELDDKTYKTYCDNNHTQLSRPAKVKIGLFYKGELVQLASFSPYKSRNGKKAIKTMDNYDWEFVRGCESFNSSRVIGGVSKLFTYFCKKYNPQSVLCYSDFNLFSGNGYASCGFELEGFTGPDKFYINEKGQRVNRSASKYKLYKQNVLNGLWLECYGAGNLRFVWKRH